jgi:hypothetical protein
MGPASFVSSLMAMLVVMERGNSNNTVTIQKSSSRDRGDAFNILIYSKFIGPFLHLFASANWHPLALSNQAWKYHVCGV